MRVWLVLLWVDFGFSVIWVFRVFVLVDLVRRLLWLVCSLRALLWLGCVDSWFAVYLLLLGLVITSVDY